MERPAQRALFARALAGLRRRIARGESAQAPRAVSTASIDTRDQGAVCARKAA